MKAVVLRLDAPLMSFGSEIIDQNGYIDTFPGTAMLTGLVANALGWHHRDFDLLQTLQARLEYAARWDVSPHRLVDYHTVEMGQDKMRQPGWTTRGTPEHRSGGATSQTGTHVRHRHYWVDGLMTVIMGLSGGGDPTIEAVAAAIARPARPLFLGRKACLPSRPLLDPLTPLVDGQTLLDILCWVAVWDRGGKPSAEQGGLMACWPADPPVGHPARVRQVFDLRDWENQLPAGSRWRAEGLLRGRCG